MKMVWEDDSAAPFIDQALSQLFFELKLRKLFIAIAADLRVITQHMLHGPLQFYQTCKGGNIIQCFKLEL